MGIRIAPMRKLRRVWNSIAVSPRIVAMMKTKRPKNPEKKIVIVVNSNKITIEIFV